MTEQTKVDPGRTIMEQLKIHTRDAHAEVESLSYFDALIDHTLPLVSYAGQLHAMAVVHGTLEAEIAAAETDLLSRVWDDRLRKLPLLEKDIAFFEPRAVAAVPDAMNAAERMAETIHRRRIDDPASLLGYLYVLEGSTLGHAMHRPDVAATFQLSGSDGLHYYTSYGDRLEESWARFSESMNTGVQAADLQDRIVNAACEAFNGLEKIYGSLYPVSTAPQKTRKKR